MDRDAGRTALLVIDVQRSMEDPRLGRRNNPGAEENVAALLAAEDVHEMALVHLHGEFPEIFTTDEVLAGCEPQPSPGTRSAHIISTS